jgi:hypothetical protein
MFVLFQLLQAFLQNIPLLSLPNSRWSFLEQRVESASFG